MFFAWMILRPAAVAKLQAPERLNLWLEVFQRFFLWVWIAVLALPVSGMGMLHMRFAGFEVAPRYVQVMMGLYLVMLALFLRVSLLQLPQLRRAIETQDWPAGARGAGAHPPPGRQQPAGRSGAGGHRGRTPDLLMRAIASRATCG